ncbi:MAG: hypothetical protein WDN45_19215 [Caulobacteraceae bacterium]
MINKSPAEQHLLLHRQQDDAAHHRRADELPLLVSKDRIRA